ncbi:MAG TPA: hypothetical protein VEZ55_04545, partial [Chitinophagaceae bacterium]|nr:hypothetical protein [Chitinophagaceae bacterium]
MRSSIAATIVAAVILIAGACTKQTTAPRDPNAGGITTTPIKKPPKAIAFVNPTSTVIEGQVKLDGSQSKDSTGLPLMYEWKLISGPAACVSYGNSQAISNASFYCPGTYHFQLKVWNWNGESFDTTKVTVGNDAYCKVTRTERPAQLRLLSKLQSAVANPQITAAGNKLIITSEFTDQFHVYDR